MNLVISVIVGLVIIIPFGVGLFSKPKPSQTDNHTYNCQDK